MKKTTHIAGKMLIFGGFLGVALFGYLALAPTHTFTLRDSELYSNKLAYEPGETVAVRLDYEAKRDMTVYADFIIHDGIWFHGDVKAIKIEEGQGVLWVDAIQVPSLAYDSQYRIEGEIYYQENFLKRMSLPIKSKGFSIKTEGNPFEYGFDEGIPITKASVYDL